MFRVNTVFSVTGKDPLETGLTLTPSPSSDIIYPYMGECDFLFYLFIFYTKLSCCFLWYVELNLRSVSKCFDNPETAANHIAPPNWNPFWRFMEFIFEMFLDGWNIYFLFLIKMDLKKESSFITCLIKMTGPQFEQKGKNIQHTWLSTITSHCIIEFSDFIKNDPF